MVLVQYIIAEYFRTHIIGIRNKNKNSSELFQYMSNNYTLITVQTVLLQCRIVYVSWIHCVCVMYQAVSHYQTVSQNHSITVSHYQTVSQYHTIRQYHSITLSDSITVSQYHTIRQYHSITVSHYQTVSQFHRIRIRIRIRIILFRKHIM